jgi:hypothetical protein
MQYLERQRLQLDVGFMVDKIALGRIFFEYFLFLGQFSFSRTYKSEIERVRFGFSVLSCKQKLWTKLFCAKLK